MHLSKQERMSLWINDHLDLYNFAESTGDEAWKQEIVEKLANRETYLQNDLIVEAKQELWAQFEQVNLEILKMYEVLKIIGIQDRHAVEEYIWELKLRRIELTNQIFMFVREESNAEKTSL